MSLLELQSRRAATDEVRQALNDAKERVAVLARARSVMRHGQTSLDAALQQVCEALHLQAEPRSILISLESSHDDSQLAERQVTTLALVVNELITNAIKHAFAGDGGRIRVTIGRKDASDVTIMVDDDGMPFEQAMSGGDGFGMGLAERLMASINGLFIRPASGSKAFELRVTV